ncbi:hypothetical protein C1645_823223 [Glomus cerebriforme]|uniref:Tc1-like transposase DDE domain-containing protein n=1 Tax=Glomus cerebriforme TaxID=658196 RepID=A0A397T2N7_9GLOM|nr:hypothetical protein C1645_823223 [Glomus cerebriforme]
MTKLSIHIHWQIVEKSLAGLSKYQIAKYLGISKTTVHCVYHFFKKYGCVENFSSLHEKSKIFGYDDMKYLEVLLKKKENFITRYGWNISEHHARKATFFIREQRFTIEDALYINNLLAYGIQEGSMNFEDYEYFIENILLPKMLLYPVQYSVLILDNASIHKSQYLQNICEEKGI